MKIFDDEKAWNDTLNDERYSYDMPFYKFHELYESYRKQNKSNFKVTHGLLTQEELENLWHQRFSN